MAEINMTGKGVSLLSLPNELLNHILQFVQSLHDLYSLSVTSSRLRDACITVSPTVLSTLAVAPESSFEPNPRQLVLAACKAQQVVEWAAVSEDNQEMLHTAILGGKSQLCQLALSQFPLQLREIAVIVCFERTIINPLVDDIVKLIGRPDVRTHFRYGGHYPSTAAEVRSALLDIEIFVQLFQKFLSERNVPRTGPSFKFSKQLSNMPRSTVVFLSRCLGADIAPAEHDSSILFNTHLVLRSMARLKESRLIADRWEMIMPGVILEHRGLRTYQAHLNMSHEERSRVFDELLRDKKDWLKGWREERGIEELEDFMEQDVMSYWDVLYTAVRGIFGKGPDS
ncbi:hypothetical protein MMC24_005367 [Lignoscripta atroalba]|nr:hypothetical protein [Lignoscripta atroalba]